MSQRFYIYPLLFAVAAQFYPLWRMGARWYGVQIAQWLMVLLVAAGAMWFSRDFVWVIAAWSLYALFVLMPRLLAHTATRRQMMRSANEAARYWQWAGRIAGGNLGGVYRTFAAVSRLWGRGDRLAAESLVDELVARPMPAAIRGEIEVWKLSQFVASRDFPAVTAYYEQLSEYGSLTADTQARLLGARAYAETGEIERALWCLQFAALSPRTIGSLETQLWAARVCVAALAGDQAGLESLLGVRPDRGRRRAARFAAYWRGRCALVRGNRAGALQQLTRARALTHPRNKLWFEVIDQHVQRAKALPETVNPVAALVVPAPGYVAGQQALRLAEQQAADWRALMHVGSPGGVTLTWLVVFGGVFLIDKIAFEGALHRPLWVWMGNVPEAVHRGQWWRPITALFLHANLLHLAMNGFALWLFGSSVEKSMGRWRYLVVFLVAGSLGNLLSAMTAPYDVSVGASGGIFGVIAAFTVATYHLDSPLYASLRRRLLQLLALMVAVDLTISGLEPQVDNLAHAGGFVAGLVLAWALYPRRTPQARS